MGALMEQPPSNGLELARIATGLSQNDLWVRYFGLGGMADALHVEAVVLGLMATTPHDRDLLVHTLNERFIELGRTDRLPYSDE